MTRAANPSGTANGQPSLRLLLGREHVRITLIAIAIAGLTVLIAGAVMIRTYTLHNLELIGRSAGYTTEAAVVFDDPIAVEEALAWVLAREEVADVAVLRADRRVLWTSRDGQAESSDGWLGKRANALIFPKPVVTPITHDGVQVGAIRLWGDASGLLHFVLVSVAGALGCMLLTAAVAVVLAQRLLHAIIDPLRRLADVAHTVRRDRAFDKRVPPAPIAELTELVDDFNALLAELESWQDNMRSENESLARLAMHDSLTGLPNRAAFEQSLKKAIRNARSTDGKLAVLFLDNDRFKETNDRFGHAAGDAVLIEVAARIRRQLREGDLVARMGGDEFAVLLAPIHADGEEHWIAERIVESMNAPIVLPDGVQVDASLSIGVACFPDPCTDEAMLLRTADAAMYEAKRARKAIEDGSSERLRPVSKGRA